jgi:hypothetical protein
MFEKRIGKAARIDSGRIRNIGDGHLKFRNGKRGTKGGVSRRKGRARGLTKVFKKRVFGGSMTTRSGFGKMGRIIPDKTLGF